jgi:hypothetical protein
VPVRNEEWQVNDIIVLKAVLMLPHFTKKVL